MIDIVRSHFGDICSICDENDPCLPRWEDDGGGMGLSDAADLSPSPEQGVEEDLERDWRHQDAAREQSSEQPV